MRPSQSALDIDEAHKLLRMCMGTQYEAAARKQLQAVVARVKLERQAKAGGL